MQLVVYKYGGTSLATSETRALAAGHVHRALEAGYQVVVVVSAIGRKDAPYSTDALLGLVGGQQQTRDLLMSCGETISACVFSDVLEQNGVSSIPMTGVQAGLLADRRFGSADIIDMDTAYVQQQLAKGKTPVITGFQGFTVSKETVTFGRGGSDTSAVEIGGYLGAESIHIFTDVSGIAVADPRIVPDAPFLESICFEDIQTLANWGARVIHPRAVAAARRHEMPVWVRSTFDHKPGTLINAGARKGLSGLAVLRGCKIVDSRDYETHTLSESPPIYLKQTPEGRRSVITIVYRPAEEIVDDVRWVSPPDSVFEKDANTLHVLLQNEEADAAVRRLYSALNARYAIDTALT